VPHYKGHRQVWLHFLEITFDGNLLKKKSFTVLTFHLSPKYPKNVSVFFHIKNVTQCKREEKSEYIISFPRQLKAINNNNKKKSSKAGIGKYIKLTWIVQSWKKQKQNNIPVNVKPFFNKTEWKRALKANVCFAYDLQSTVSPSGVDAGFASGVNDLQDNNISLVFSQASVLWTCNSSLTTARCGFCFCWADLMNSHQLN